MLANAGFALSGSAQKHRRVTLLSCIGRHFEQSHLFEALNGSLDSLTEAGMEHWDLASDVEVLDAKVELLDQSLLLDDEVFAAELLDCGKSDDVGVDQGQN